MTIKDEHFFKFLLDYIEYQIVVYSMDQFFKMLQPFNNKKCYKTFSISSKRIGLINCTITKMLLLKVVIRKGEILSLEEGPIYLLSFLFIFSCQTF